jgi:hypothetical protein
MQAKRNPEFSPELRGYQKGFLDVRERFEQILAGMTLEQFNWRPNSGRWSVGQNVDHLNRGLSEQFPIVERLVERGRSENTYSPGPYRHGWFGQFFIWFIEPPYKVKITAVPQYVPPSQLTFDAVVPEFMALKARVLALIDHANGLDLGRLRAPLSIRRGLNLSLSLGQWLHFLVAHERRHLWQMEQLLFPHPDFPRRAGGSDAAL